MKAGDILEFIHHTEKLKQELRHSWLFNGRQESVAEHTWRLALMVMLMAPNLDQKINLPRAIKMAVIHDINEAAVGDVPAFLIEESKNQKKLEEKNIIGLKNKYNSSVMDEIYELWKEYEDEKTTEAKFVKALDRLEARIQRNEAKIDTWNEVEYERSQFSADKYCEFDSFLKVFNKLVKEESKEKIIKESSKNFDDIIKEVEKKIKKK